MNDDDLRRAYQLYRSQANRLPDAPTIDEIASLVDGSLSSGQRERLLERTVADPEATRALGLLQGLAKAARPAAPPEPRPKWARAASALVGAATLSLPRKRIPVEQGGFGVAAPDSAMPVAFGKPAVAGITDDVRPRRSIPSIALRLVVDAVIAVALMAMVPISLVAVGGSALTRGGSFTDYVHRLVVKTDSWRSLALTSDSLITPTQAGRAYAAIQPAKSGNGFTALEPGTPPAMSWRDAVLTPDMFTAAVPGGAHLPPARGILQAALKGFSPRELEFLRVLATAPAWRQFDMVARAPAVDFLGGQYRLPFGADAFSESRIQSHQDIREMAAAAVSRAAYHMAIGQQDSAVTILRTIVSVGFVMVDNGTTALDELIGNGIIDIGRIALRQYYELQHDPRALSAMLAPAVRPNQQPDSAGNPDEFRASLIAILDDPTRTRGERFESLQMLVLSSCSNVRDLIAGPRSDVTRAIDSARRTLVRYPSDRALFDLMVATRAPTPPEGSSNRVSDLAVSAASVAGAVFHNPRFAMCTRMITLW